MQRFLNYLHLAVLPMAMFGAWPSAASEIFHWVDEDGVLTFSDWAPDDNNVEVSKVMVVDSNPPDYDPRQDEHSILDQAQRINARWEVLKERQDERRAQRIENQERQRVPQTIEYDDYDYPWYGAGYYLRPGFVPGAVRPPRPFVTPKRQLAAMDSLGLLERPRPHSINSSAHLARINAGTGLNPMPRPPRPGRPRPAPHVTEW